MVGLFVKLQYSIVTCFRCRLFCLRWSSAVSRDFSFGFLISGLVDLMQCKSGAPVFLSFLVDITWKDYCVRVVPTALATALDIDLTNVSLVFISCKSGAPVFLLRFQVSFGAEDVLKMKTVRETPSYKLLGIMLIISFGALLTVAKETEFNVAGFILIMAAAIMSGFRSIVTQLLLQVSVEYLRISKTRAIALTFAGVAMMFLMDNLTLLKGTGLGVIMIGVSLLNWLRYQKLVHGGSGEHGLSHQNQNHSYVAIKENHAVFEVEEELEEDTV
ncbi:hypothetical protein R1sor_024389 [Riccia sorocarpa]|uniref:Uncharacterized protein n=1 Tax=Riccia sorocarpa TaxID=122646 RepID=A0ABD3GQI9_9MARC